jgi:cytochrome b561
MESKVKNKNRNKIVLAFDTAMFTGFLVTGVPSLEGRTLHEWFGIACAAMAVTHLLINWTWITAMVKRVFKPLNLQARVSTLLNAALFVDVTLLIFSGLMISEVALRSLGIELPRSETWRPIHVLAANGFLTLVGLHVALHVGWIWTTLKRMVGRVHLPRLARRTPSWGPGSATGLAAAHIEEVRS